MQNLWTNQILKIDTPLELKNRQKENGIISFIYLEP
jgi:hypothetical protein